MWTEVLTIIASAIGSVVAIIGANVVLISWLRSDMKSFENRIETKLDSWKNETNKETMDFHGRLCTVEERSKK